MPEWFKMLGFITVAAIMVTFLLSLVAAIVIFGFAAIKDYVDSRRDLKSRRRQHEHD